MEGPFEGGQGPEGAAAPHVDGRKSVSPWQLLFCRCFTLYEGLTQHAHWGTRIQDRRSQSLLLTKQRVTLFNLLALEFGI
jgi:hypothetical protein